MQCNNYLFIFLKKDMIVSLNEHIKILSLTGAPIILKQDLKKQQVFKVFCNAIRFGTVTKKAWLLGADR